MSEFGLKPLFPEKTLKLKPALFGSIERYAAIAACGSAVVDISSAFNKREKSSHRFAIADVNGPMNLTIPIEKPHSITASRWADINLSAHGGWWNTHLTALESAYGRTPFFEFVIDRFKPFFAPDSVTRFKTLMAFDEAAEQAVCEFLGLNAPSYIMQEDNAVSTDSINDIYMRSVEYYQIRLHNRGEFLSGMSVLDLIFNCGPESVFVLKKMVEQ